MVLIINGTYYQWYLPSMVLIINSAYYQWYLLAMVLIISGTYPTKSVKGNMQQVCFATDGRFA
jgi:hypothetical protein